jgi:Ankyrin repeats (many copies)/Ankyrin repeats (3 copies)
MRLKSVVLLSGLALITASCSVRSASTSDQSKERRLIATGESQEKEDWKSKNVVGFEVWVASNLVSEEIRTMYLLAEAGSFTDQNLKVIFTGLAAEFAEPKALRLTMMSDPAPLKAAMNGPIVTLGLSDGENHSGRTRTQQPDRRERDDEKGYFEARYIRSSDEDEEYFWYTPDPHSSNHINVTLKSRPAKVYTGNLDWDLLVATEKGDTTKLRTLLTRGADANGCDRHGSSALMKAALYGHPAIVEMLMERGADVNARDDNGWTPLMSAASNGNPETVELLLRGGVAVNVRDRFGNTALLVAAGHTESDFDKGRADALKNVASLLEKGADVNLVDNGGETPLFKAVARGDIRMVGALLEKGADPNIKNASDLTVLRSAQRQGQAEIMELLIRAGARD